MEADAAGRGPPTRATAARIADTGLREARQRLANLVRRTAAAHRDRQRPDQAPCSDRLAAQAQLNDNGPNGLSSRIVTALSCDAARPHRTRTRPTPRRPRSDAEAAELDRWHGRARRRPAAVARHAATARRPAARPASAAGPGTT
ncbi:hypothetical protein HBB16_17560 [Pseudonocardia sp. MCCB 268]|nr:hypothetical protein [Pseudonocardia cytotoxica]